MKIVIAQLLIGLVAWPINAQTTDGALANKLLDETEKILNEKGITTDNIIDQAKKQINRAPGEPIYDKQKVEMPGIWSKGEKLDTELLKQFDQQINTSVFDRRTATSAGLFKQTILLAHDFRQGGEDLTSAIVDRNGTLSDQALKAIAPLQGKEVNQLVCHSWGTEIAYNAILTGQIKPPREIFVLAPPSLNDEKWRVLSAKTGTIVHVYRGADDPVPAAADIIGGASRTLPNGMPPAMAKAVEQTAGIARLSLTTRTELEQLWDKKFPKTGNLHGRVKRDAQGHCLEQFTSCSDIKTGGHDRSGYYKELFSPGAVLSKSAAQLAAQQDTRVVNEAEKIFEEAAVKAEDQIVQAEAIKGKLELEAAKRKEADKLAQLDQQCKAFIEEDDHWKADAPGRASRRQAEAQRLADQDAKNRQAEMVQAQNLDYALNTFADYSYDSLFSMDPNAVDVAHSVLEVSYEHYRKTIASKQNLDYFIACKATKHQKQALQLLIAKGWTLESSYYDYMEYIRANSKWDAAAAKSAAKEKKKEEKEKIRIAKEEERKKWWAAWNASGDPPDKHPSGNSSGNPSGGSGVKGNVPSGAPDWDGTSPH